MQSWKFVSFSVASQLNDLSLYQAYQKVGDDFNVAIQVLNLYLYNCILTSWNPILLHVCPFAQVTIAMLLKVLGFGMLKYVST